MKKQKCVHEYENYAYVEGHYYVIDFVHGNREEPYITCAGIWCRKCHKKVEGSEEWLPRDMVCNEGSPYGCKIKNIEN